MYRLVIHGGAGALARECLTPSVAAAYHDALADALASGAAVLASGGRSLDAAQEAVRSLEDCPLFNAGRGSVLNRDGIVEMDASLMDGRDLRAGAVALVRGVQNPILLARSILEGGQVVMLGGEAAQAWARDHGLILREATYFVTPLRQDQWAEGAAGSLSEDVVAAEAVTRAGPEGLGTVGAVALDVHGDLAAATSTGGTNRKPPGRIGDTALIGAGTYAENGRCAVSCTGHGESFVRVVAAHAIACCGAGQSLEEAVASVLQGRLGAVGGSGGAIALDAAGRLVTAYTTDGMYRGAIGDDLPAVTAIFDDDAGVLRGQLSAS